jgi:CheY-like chemotaxis protein
VFDNVLINAKQAMPLGGRVVIRTENPDAPESERASGSKGARVRVLVSDQGCGIPKEHLSRVFDPFFTTKQSGSGLGLATAYSIVHRHGGAIDVESESGKGTRIRVDLPARTETGAPEIATAAAPITERALPRRILVLDDEHYIREVLSLMMKSMGCEVDAVASGDEVVELYRRARDVGRSYDLVILDLTVPGGRGGVEVLAELLKMDPGVRAVASSGYSDDPVMADPRAAGFLASLPKPYRVADLARVLREMCGSVER